MTETQCSLCGGVGHRPTDCPWTRCVPSADVSAATAVQLRAYIRTPDVAADTAARLIADIHTRPASGIH